MDTKKLKAALAAAQNELNTLTDAEFKARRITSLRPLTLAGNALELASKHIEKAEERAAGKADAPAGDAAATTGAPKK